MALAAFGMVSIVGFCLFAAACDRRPGDRGEAANSAPAQDGRGLNEVDERAGIAQAWKEQDQMVHEHLDGYGWVDRAAGVVHIPVERAMNLILAEKKSPGLQSVRRIEAPGAGRTDTALQRAGRRLFRQYGCDICHAPDAVIHAPSLDGVSGQRVRLSDGTFVRADDQYLHDSILQASKQVVAGYAPVMPAYRGVIPEPDVLALIAYLKSFTGGESTPGPAARP
jgi:mono/diheme cytochrome c family protein